MVAERESTISNPSAASDFVTSAAFVVRPATGASSPSPSSAATDPITTRPTRSGVSSANVSVGSDETTAVTSSLSSPSLPSTGSPPSFASTSMGSSPLIVMITDLATTAE